MGVGVFCSVIFSNFAFCQGQSALPQHPHRLASHAPSQELLNALTKTSSTTIMEAHLPAAVVDATLIWCALLTQAPSLESGSKSSPHCVLLMAAAVRVSRKNKNKKDLVPSHILNILNTLYRYTTGVISSPNFPSNYPFRIAKTDTIKVEQGMVILLKFNAFDIEYKSNCHKTQYTTVYDFLMITDGDGTTLMEGSCGSTADGNIRVGGQSLGSSLPADIISRSNVVNLIFNTNWHTARSGWSVTWQALAPGKKEQH